MTFSSFVAGENINLAWSPDGTTLAVGNKDDLITFIDVKTSKLVLLLIIRNKDENLFFSI